MQKQVKWLYYLSSYLGWFIFTPLYLCHVPPHAIGHLTVGFLATATPCLHFHCESHLVLTILMRYSVYCIRTN